MKKLLGFLFSLLMVTFLCGTANALTIDQTGNLLNNGSFETGSFDPVTGHGVQSAANLWNQWSNSGGTLTTELITNAEMNSFFGTGVVDADSAFRITTSGSGDGGYTFESFHTPGWDTGAALTLSAWVYVVSGEMRLLNGSNSTGFVGSASTTTGQWEFLSVSVAAGLLNNEPLLYSVNGAADFIVDSAWLNLGTSIEHPGAPVPEPATLLLFGIGILGIAGVTRKKLQK